MIGSPAQLPEETPTLVSTEEGRTAAAMIASSLLFAVSMALATLGLTWWLSSRWDPHSGTQLSPVDFLAFLFYLLDVVAIIRLVCFAAMLLSARRKDDAVDLMPAAPVGRKFMGRLHSPSTSKCKRIGSVVLVEAVSLGAVWWWSIHRLMHLQ